MERVKLSGPKSTYAEAADIARRARQNADPQNRDNKINNQVRFGVRRLSSGFVPFERR